MDRISQLPEHLMQKILFCLPAEDAIRVEFVSSTDESLRILHQHEDQKRIIRHFNLTWWSGEEVDASTVDRWIKLVTKHYVKELKLYGSCGIQRYRFPPTSVDAGSLVVLKLSSCIWEKKHLIQEGTRFSCLQELRLSDVDLNGIDIIEDFLPRCPSLVTLELYYCVNNMNSDLQLCGLRFPKLKHVYLQFGSQVYSFKIQADNLKTFHYGTLFPDRLGTPVDLQAINCSNLKELQMFTPNATINQKYVDEICSKFPFPEVLELKAGTLQSAKLKISSQQLKKFTLDLGDNSCGVKAVEIDSPNLLEYSLRYFDKIPTVLPLFSSNSMKLKQVRTHLRLEREARLNTWWFLRLRQYLGKSSGTQHQELILSSQIESSEKSFSLEELRSAAEEVSPPSRVKHLEVGYPITASEDYVDASLDGLLWSCHPTTLVINLDNYSIRSDEDMNIKLEKALVRVIYEKLMCREENPMCCGDSRNIKCWRHSLKSVRLQSFCCSQYGQPVTYNIEHSSRLNCKFKYLETVSQVIFELHWKNSKETQVTVIAYSRTLSYSLRL